MRTLLVLLVFAQAAGAAYSQNTKVKAVENNLAGWFKPTGKGWSLQERMKEAGINGLTIAVIDNYKISWVRSYGYADTSERRTVTNKTLFQSASIGKSIHGLTCMILSKSGKLNLDTDINKYLARWKFNYDTIKPATSITLRRILSHTAGFGVHGFDGYKWNQPLPNLLQIINGEKPANNPPVRLIDQPGKRFSYSGGGYEISELLLEDVFETDYAKLIQANVFDPLGMNNSTYVTRPSQATAAAYRSDGQSIGYRYHLYPEKACGAALWTTAQDIAKFVIAVQSALKGKKGAIIDKGSAQRLLSIQPNAEKYALGFFIENRGGESYFHHSGLNEGFSSVYFGSTNGGRGMVVLCNSDDLRFLDEVVNSVATVYKWKNFHHPVEKKLVQLPAKLLSRYVGQYKFSDTNDGPLITLENGVLFLQTPGNFQKWRMHFTDEESCYMLEAQGVEQRFVFDGIREVKGFYILGANNYKAYVEKLR